MDRKTAIEKVKQYADIIAAQFPVRKVVLYGSYARGNARPESDIDVAVVVDRIEGDFLDSASKLFRLRREIDLRIEPVLLEQTHDASGFLEEILRTGELVYSA